ncbi:unnamed protein product [Ascophyllum nodosum]
MALRQLSLLGSRGATLRRNVIDGVSQDQRRRIRAKRSPKAVVGVSATSTRLFHPSAKRELLPVIGGAIAVAALATGLRYLIRAGKRMREMEEEEKRRGGGAGGAGSGGVDSGGGGPGDASHSNGPAFGVDVGVTNLRLAFANSIEMRPEVVENREGSRWTPACVSFKGGGDPVVGTMAKAQRFEAAATTMLGMQPLVGLPFSDPVVQAMAAASGVDGLGGGVIEKAVGGLAGFRIGEGGNVLSAQEGLSLMLANIRGLAEHKVQAGGAAVLSYPAYFNEHQREAVALAGEHAGMVVLDTIEEPVAAVMAADEMGLPLGGGRSTGRLVAVLDVGGRTAQCSIVDAGIKGEGERPSLVGTDWTAETGGDQWDAGIVDLLDDEFQMANGGLSLKGDDMARGRSRLMDGSWVPIVLPSPADSLFDAATAARVELTRAQQAHVNIPFITADRTGPKHLDVILTRAKIDRAMEPLLRMAEAPCVSALSMAQVDPSSISSVLLVGGCSRMPALQDLAKKVFGRAGAGPVLTPEQGDEYVALGAALEARHMVYE